MKSFLLAASLFLLLPGVAFGAGTTSAVRDVSVGVNRAPARFDLVGLHWRGIGIVSFRTRSVSGRWSGWRYAAPEDDRPDSGNHELRARGWQLGSPFWTGPSNRIQVQTSGDVKRVRAYYVWSRADARPLRA